MRTGVWVGSGRSPFGNRPGVYSFQPYRYPCPLTFGQVSCPCAPHGGQDQVGQESWSGACLGIWSFSFLVLKRIGRVHYRLLLTGELSRVEMAKYDCVLSLNKTPSISFRESLDDKQYSCALNREGGFWFLTPVLYWPCYPLIAVPCL